MVYCNCKKTHHNKDLLCTYYNHYSVNSKKNLPIPEKVKSEGHGSHIPCLQSFFHLLHQGRPISFGHLKSYSGSLSARKNIIGLWHHRRTHGTGFGSGCGNLSQNQQLTGGYLQPLMTLSTQKLAVRFLDAPIYSIMPPSTISQNIPGRRMLFQLGCSK